METSRASCTGRASWSTAYESITPERHYSNIITLNDTFCTCPPCGRSGHSAHLYRGTVGGLPPSACGGDGSQSRCFCDVRDVVPAMVALLDEPEHHGRVFNVGSNQPMTISALAEFVREELGGESEIRNVPYEEAFSDGFDDLQAREPDLKRVKEAIGFAPRIGLDQTIRDLADSMGRGKVRG